MSEALGHENSQRITRSEVLFKVTADDEIYFSGEKIKLPAVLYEGTVQTAHFCPQANLVSSHTYIYIYIH